MRIGKPTLNDLWDAKLYGGDVVEGEFVLLAQFQHRIDSSGDARRRRMRLHQHIHEMEALTQSFFDQGSIPVAGIGTGKAALPLNNVVRPAVTLRCKKGSGDAAFSGMRRVNALG